MRPAYRLPHILALPLAQLVGQSIEHSDLRTIVEQGCLYLAQIVVPVHQLHRVSLAEAMRAEVDGKAARPLRSLDVGPDRLTGLVLAWVGWARKGPA